MTVEEIAKIKSKGVLFRRSENGCEMYCVIGKLNPKFGKPDHHWYMISEKTGVHLITTQSNRPDERIDNHWAGFKQNQETTIFSKK